MRKIKNLKNKNYIDKNNLPEKSIPKNKNYKDLTNQNFGKLVALYPCGYLTKEKRLAWCCKCDCGQYLAVTGKNLLNGNTQSCGCLHREKIIDSNHKRGKTISIGDVFGKLTVIKSLGFKTHGQKRNEKFLCKCSCGNEIEVWGVYLNFGDTQSCGCVKSRGEQAILNFLQKHNIPFKKEQSYTDLLSEQGYPLRFDFLIKDFLIEYQGDIHYQSRETGWNNKEEFLIRQQRDKVKKEYCLKNNIHLYEITYKDDCINKLKEILEKEDIIYE